MAPRPKLTDNQLFLSDQKTDVEPDLDDRKDFEPMKENAPIGPTELQKREEK